MQNNLVTVIHGANDGEFPVAGQTIATVMASLVDAFNIPNDAIAFLNGAKVEFSTTLSGGDVLEFVRVAGEKGLGDMISSVDLMNLWKINVSQYEAFLSMGLPVLRLPDGSAWHPEYAVDEWSRSLATNRIDPEPPFCTDALNDCERAIVESLGTKKMTANEIGKQAGYPLNSNFKATLSSMVKRGLLVNDHPGYRRAKR